MINFDTSNPGKAADVVARAAILFTRTLGMEATNLKRQRDGQAPMYDVAAFDQLIEDIFPETQE